MSKTAARVAWTIWAFSIVGILVACVAALFGRDSGSVAGVVATAGALAFAGSCATVGALIAARRPDNPIGWLLIAGGMCFAIPAVAVEVLTAWERFSDWLGSWIWMAGIAFVMVFVPLLFPDGRLPSPRWRPAMWFASLGLTVFIAGSSLLPGKIEETHTVNPFGVGGAAGHALFSSMRTVGLFTILVSVPLALASLVFRYRAADRIQREQLRWLILAGVLVALGILANPIVTGLVSDQATATDIGNAFASFTVAAVPVAIGIAILRYRLYDIDVVLNKTVVYGALATFITGVYVAIVVGVSTLVPVGADSPLLSIAATGVVALTFQPARDRVQRFANRIVYGQRSTPYEVLTRFSDRIGNTYANDDLLPRTARVIAEGVNAERATIWLHLADELRPAAGWPEVDPSARPIDLDDEALPDVPGEHVAEIRYRGDLLGAISVDERRGDPLNPGEIRLVDDLAAQAGLVVSNVRLTADLEARLDVITRQAAELRASRQRIVAAQDEERRRLERNIHDGAQQHLVALAVKLRLARALLGRDPEKARTMLEETGGQIDEALETLHALALGIYPPRLESDGVAAALAARYASSDLPVRFHADGVGRYPLDTEAAIYFCVLEALQNAAKYSTAGSIDVTFGEWNGALTFEMVDDGIGFDAAVGRNGTGLDGMRDRLAVLGGDVSLTSAPGRGTTVRGQVPLTEAVTA